MSESDPPALRLILEHVVSQYHDHNAAHSKLVPPLVVGIQGPQGSGKTFLSSLLRDRLSSLLKPLVAVVVSIDDLYLPHHGLKAVAEANFDNPLLQGRGQPGTHDIDLGIDLLSALHHINESDRNPHVVNIPSFDKSLYNGEGDRAPEDTWTSVQAPLDIIILEGWFVGFEPCATHVLSGLYASPITSLDGAFDLQKFCTEKNILEISDKLVDYRKLWRFIQTFIQLYPEHGDLKYVYQWRLQQEHAMRAKNGGRGMTDELVKKFVDRYMPGYIFFAHGVTKETQLWKGKGLRLVINEHRTIVGTEPI